MNNERLITLVPSSTETISFEDAFGEFSEARGKRKNRRSKRKAKRQEHKSNRQNKHKAKRQERKSKHNSKQQERRSNRQERRKSKRQEHKSKHQERRTNRQDKHDEKLDRRLQRKRQRAEEKAYRREISKPEEEEYEEPYLEDNYDDGDEYDDESNYENDYSDEGDYDDYPEDDYPEDDYPEDDYPEDDYPEDDYNDDYDDNYYADEEYDDYDDDDWGYFDASNSGVDGSISVNPRIQKITDKIEFNKEALSRETAKHKAKPSIETKKRGRAIVDRIKWLEAKLKAFMDNAKVEEKREARRNHIGMAKKKSIGQRIALHNRMKSKGRRKDKTIVSNDLDSKISKNKIVIPADKETSNLTGINGIDLQEDFDAPKPRVVEITSNADGRTISNTQIAIPLIVGVALGLAIMELKKSK